MNGIRKKISLGFFCLVLMLMFSGLVSLFELRRLSRSTRELLETSSQNMELSKSMLDAAQQQNTSLLQTIVLGGDDFDESFNEARTRFEAVLSEASDNPADRIELANIHSARDNYYQLLGNYFDDAYNTDIAWFLEMYETSYSQLTDAIKKYMVDSQHSLLNQSSELRSNAYRAMMPGVITLCVAILMALVFAYLLNLYYTRPLLDIDRSLKAYIAHRVPFRVKMEGRDEINSIRENIETLINTRREQ